MTILRLFLNFLNKILNIQILNVSLLNWLIITTILIFVFRIIYEIAGIRKSTKTIETKEKSDKE